MQQSAVSLRRSGFQLPADRGRPVEPCPLRFRMIIRLPLFPVYFRPVLRYVYANYRRRWNRVVNRIIFRWRSRQMSREHAPTLSRRRIAMLRNDRSISLSLGNVATMMTLIWRGLTIRTRNDWIFVTFVCLLGLLLFADHCVKLATMLNSDGHFCIKRDN